MLLRGPTLLGKKFLRGLDDGFSESVVQIGIDSSEIWRKFAVSLMRCFESSAICQYPVGGIGYY